MFKKLRLKIAYNLMHSELDRLIDEINKSEKFINYSKMHDKYNAHLLENKLSKLRRHKEVVRDSIYFLSDRIERGD